MTILRTRATTATLRRSGARGTMFSDFGFLFVFILSPGEGNWTSITNGLEHLGGEGEQETSFWLLLLHSKLQSCSHEPTKKVAQVSPVFQRLGALDMSVQHQRNNTQVAPT